MDLWLFLSLLGSKKCLITSGHNLSLGRNRIENEWGAGRRMLVSDDQKENNAISDWSLNASWDFQWMANNYEQNKKNLLIWKHIITGGDMTALKST